MSGGRVPSDSSPGRPRSTRSSSAASGNVPQSTMPSSRDGNRDSPAVNMAIDAHVNRNVDMSTTMWAHVNGQEVQIVRRPANPSTLGSKISVVVNTFNVNALPSVPVYQYDVSFPGNDDKKILIRKLWASKAVKDALPIPQRWIFDGSKIAWSTEKLDREIRLMIDLDEEEGRTSKKPNVHKFALKPTTTNVTVRFDNLEAFLHGKADFSTSCLEAINFLDHLLREQPTQRLTSIRRAFYEPGQGQRRIALGSGIELFKGVYQSMRPVHSPTGKHLMSINVDVSNGIFWTAQPLARAIGAILGINNEADLGPRLRTIPEKLKDLRHVQVLAKHYGHGQNQPELKIDKVVSATAQSHKITDGESRGMNLVEYFRSKYNIKLNHPEWPLVKMTKGQNTLIPLELLTIKENSKCNYKLDDRQTSLLVRNAVTKPTIRWSDIQHGLGLLDWENDMYLKGYGLKINTKPVEAPARLLSAPDTVFQNGSQRPGYSGRWRVDGKKFLMPNPQPLKSWGCCVIPSPRSRGPANIAEQAMSNFVRVYKGHGGVIAASPFILTAENSDPARAAAEAWTKIGNNFKSKPQILFFILPVKDAMLYGRVKKSCECRFGVVSQCMLAEKLMRANDQYFSNVALKVNAKLGGYTNRAVGPKSKGPKGLFTIPTMCVGADVTHPAPRGQRAEDEQLSSIAAITASLDPLCIKYACGVNSNGYRKELIETANWDKLFKPALRNWMSTVGGGHFPKHLFYFRDGVSEGQFPGVLNQEVRDIKALLNSGNPGHGVKICVIIVTKRHHYRFFPKTGGDKNGNALPGTLVETAITHPQENDFFLCSHAAIQGTARPAHYHILLNETGLKNEDIQTMIYEMCYSFVRATTPVSLVPAAYYADIAAIRGRHHDAKFGSALPPPPTRERAQANQGPPQKGPTGPTSSSTPTNIDDLMYMPPGNGISQSMWYI